MRPNHANRRTKKWTFSDWNQPLGLSDSAGLDFHERQEWRASGKTLVKPDYQACIEIATRASLREMIAPGVLVIATPILVGSFLGVQVMLEIANQTWHQRPLPTDSFVSLSPSSITKLVGLNAQNVF